LDEEDSDFDSELCESEAQSHGFGYEAIPGYHSLPIENHELLFASEAALKAHQDEMCEH